MFQVKFVQFFTRTDLPKGHFRIFLNSEKGKSRGQYRGARKT